MAATLKTGAERLRLNSPDANLRRWRAKTESRDPNASSKTSPLIVKLKEELDRANREIARGGGDLWDKDDRVEDIADIMLTKLTANKAENVARTILTKLKERKKAQSTTQAAAASAEERKALYADIDESRS